MHGRGTSGIYAVCGSVRVIKVKMKKEQCFKERRLPASSDFSGAAVCAVGCQRGKGGQSGDGNVFVL